MGADKRECDDKEGRYASLLYSSSLSALLISISTNAALFIMLFDYTGAIEWFCDLAARDTNTDLCGSRFQAFWAILFVFINTDILRRFSKGCSPSAEDWDVVKSKVFKRHEIKDIRSGKVVHRSVPTWFVVAGISVGVLMFLHSVFDLVFRPLLFASQSVEGAAGTSLLYQMFLVTFSPPYLIVLVRLLLAKMHRKY